MCINFLFIWWYVLVRKYHWQRCLLLLFNLTKCVIILTSMDIILGGGRRYIHIINILFHQYSLHTWTAILFKIYTILNNCPLSSLSSFNFMNIYPVTLLILVYKLFCYYYSSHSPVCLAVWFNSSLSLLLAKQLNKVLAKYIECTHTLQYYHFFIKGVSPYTAVL